MLYGHPVYFDCRRGTQTNDDCHSEISKYLQFFHIHLMAGHAAHTRISEKVTVNISSCPRSRSDYHKQIVLFLLVRFDGLSF